ncbi:hypothetical protein AAC387_Pa04g1212 [Persea americana]
MLQKFKNTYEITRFHKPIVFLKQSRNFHVNVSYTNYSSLLRDAIKTKSLAKTQEIHAQTLIHGLFAGTHIANLTMESYFKCGESKLAHQVFEQMPERDSMSWTHVVSSYSQNKQSEKAIRFFRLMNQQGCDPNRASLISALSSCGHISKSIQGKQLHSQVVRRIPPSDVTVCNVLIDFYSRCGELSEAWLMFDETLDKDLVSWTTMLSGYSQNGLSREALDFFILMHSQDMGFSQYAFSVTAKACGELRNSKAGEELHCLVIKTGFESQVFVASALLDMYSKQGKTTFVRKVFELMDEPNVVSWTSIITAYVQIDKGEEALDLFKHQLQVGVQPDAFSLSSILAACANIPALEFGKQIHSHIIKSGFEFQIFAGTATLEPSKNLPGKFPILSIESGIATDRIPSATSLAILTSITNKQGGFWFGGEQGAVIYQDYMGVQMAWVIGPWFEKAKRPDLFLVFIVCVTFQILILDEIYVRLEKGEIDITGSCYFRALLQFVFSMLHVNFVRLFMNLNAVP